MAALQERADIYHVHDPELLPWAQLLRAAGRRVVFDMHEHVPNAILDKKWIPTGLRRIVSASYRAAERLLMAGMPVVFAEASYERDYLWVKRHATVLNMPLVRELLAISTEKAAEPTVGYMGMVAAARGSALTIEALGLLRSRGMPIRFQCVGPATRAHATELAELAGVLGVPLHMTGRLSAQDGWRLMARCSVGVALLKDLPNYRDSYPTKMFEYMALGLPVVVSDVPLYRSVVERFGCGLAVNPEDPSAVAEAIEWLIRHRRDAESMGERGRKAVVEHFSWASEFGKLADLYSITSVPEPRHVRCKAR